MPECYRCDKTATGVYESIRPPAGTVRRAACDDHAPDIPPVKEVKGDA